VTAEAPTKLDHGEARRRWGAPQEWEGCVNDPRTREEYGIRWNEKWIYRLEDGSQRIVYWHRYNCRGVLRVDPSGEIASEAV